MPSNSFVKSSLKLDLGNFSPVDLNSTAWAVLLLFLRSFLKELSFDSMLFFLRRRRGVSGSVFGLHGVF